MASQLDLDQGGTAREWVNQYLGPSVGWVRVPARNSLVITAAGTYSILLSTSLVLVDVAGAVTIILPTALGPSSQGGTGGATDGALPGFAVKNPITVVDIGGFAFANPITIKPISGTPGYTGQTENILGLSQIQITANYGGFSLRPDGTMQGWTNPQ